MVFDSKDRYATVIKSSKVALKIFFNIETALAVTVGEKTLWIALYRPNWCKRTYSRPPAAFKRYITKSTFCPPLPPHGHSGAAAA